MDINEAKILAELHLEKHGLSEWRVVFDNAKKRMGQCRFREKVISLSRPLVSLNKEYHVEDTILHEIAHAIVGPSHGHDRVFWRKAYELGCMPKQEKWAEIVKPKGLFVLVCPRCNTETHMHKRTNNDYWCYPCKKKLGLLITLKRSGM